MYAQSAPVTSMCSHLLQSFLLQNPLSNERLPHVSNGFASSILLADDLLKPYAHMFSMYPVCTKSTIVHGGEGRNLLLHLTLQLGDGILSYSLILGADNL